MGDDDSKNEPKIKQEAIKQEEVPVENKEVTKEVIMQEVKIPIFDGQDYGNWKKRIVMYLKMKKCDIVVTRAKLEADNEDWDEKGVQDINYIYSAISNRQMELINDKTTAFEIIKKFDTMYLKESTALQIICRNKLDNLRLKDFSNSSEFFNEFEKLVNNLKEAGANVTEKEKLNYMLKTLPSSMSHIGDLVDVLKEEDQNVEYVKNKIKMIELREKNESESSRSNAFVFEKGKKVENKRTCYVCGERGHIQYDCPMKNNSGNRAPQQGGGRGSRAPQRGGGIGRGYSQQREGTNGRGANQHRTSFNRRGSSSYGQRGRGARASEDSHQGQQSAEAKAAFNASVQVKSAYTENSNVNVNKIDWILDSGCSDHVINNENYFSNTIELKEPINVRIGDGRILKATKVGCVKSKFKTFNENETNIEMKDVFYVKDMDRNLISFAKVTDNYKIVSIGDSSKIYDKNKLIAVAWKKDRIYKMTSYLENDLEANLTTQKSNKMTLKEKWHRTLGHVNFNYLNTMCKNKILEGLPNQIESDYFKCATCIENKMHNIPFENNRKKAKEILEIVHTDLNGPHSEGYKGEKYFITFIDDYSKLAKVYPIKTKDEVFEKFVEYINLIENGTGKKIKKLRCDNGTEYLNKDMYRLFREKGIEIQPCPPYVHELNGTAERYNRTIMDSARCLLAESKIEKRYWPEVICAAAYLKNRTIVNTLEKNKSPYEIFFNEEPDVKHLKLYGSKVFVRVPENKRNSKWDRKADLGILVGYDMTGYRILINNRVIVARHVDIIEEDVKCIGLNDNNLENENINKNLENDNEGLLPSTSTLESSRGRETDPETEKVNENHENELEEVPELRRSKRVINKPVRFDDNYVYSGYIYVNFCSVDTPVTFAEAIESDESSFWIEAMNKEMNSLNKNKTWKLVEKPKNEKVLDLKWIYTKKSENIYKARIVVKGFQQTNLVDDIYSPVAKTQTLKVLLSYCCQNGLLVEQMDVETAFLNGDLKSRVFVKQPEGYEDGTERVCMLNKALYGLSESPRAWYECLDSYLKSIGFVRSEHDYCLYTLKVKYEIIYLIIFVEDLLICCKNKQNLNFIKGLLKERFQMKDLGKVSTYLGINIKYDEKKNEMSLDQENYIESLARKYQIEEAKLYETPMEQNLKLEPAEEPSEGLKYRNLIGALLYISSGTRLDISYSVNYLSRFQNCYNESHYKYALRVLKYLYLTKSLKLRFKKNDKVDILECYVDADWAGDCVDRKSTTGYIVKLFGNVIHWKSRKQGSVTKSSTAAEYVALSEAVSEILLIKDLLRDFNLRLEKPVNIYEDNSGAVSIAKFGNFTKKSKYIEVHYHFVNENYEKGVIEINKISSEKNVADMLTKALGRVRFENLRKLLNLI